MIQIWMPSRRFHSIEMRGPIKLPIQMIANWDSINLFKNALAQSTWSVAWLLHYQRLSIQRYFNYFNFNYEYKLFGMATFVTLMNPLMSYNQQRFKIRGKSVLSFKFNPFVRLWSDWKCSGICWTYRFNVIHNAVFSPN